MVAMKKTKQIIKGEGRERDGVGWGRLRGVLAHKTKASNDNINENRLLVL